MKGCKSPDLPGLIRALPAPGRDHGARRCCASCRWGPSAKGDKASPGSQQGDHQGLTVAKAASSAGGPQRRRVRENAVRRSHPSDLHALCWKTSVLLAFGSAQLQPRSLEVVIFPPSKVQRLNLEVLTFSCLKVQNFNPAAFRFLPFHPAKFKTSALQP